LTIRKQRMKAEGSITVFLSLVLLLILSLLLTIIEGARVNTAKVFAERSLTTAMDSVLAEYYGPLWEEYHIFGLDTGNGTLSERKDIITDKMKDYMSYTFDPYKNLDATVCRNGTELYNITVDELSIQDQTMLMDYHGKIFINQAVEYMKYKELGEGLEQLLEKMSMLESPKKVSMVYEKKQKVEEELVEIEEGILELMELLDGIKTSKKGIEISKAGSLHIVNFFIKKICPNEITQNNVGINQESIFHSLKDNYINPLDKLNSIDEAFLNLEETILQIKEVQKEYEILLLRHSEAEVKHRELNSLEETNDVKAQKLENSNLIISLEEQLEKSINQKEELTEEKQRNISAITSLNIELTNTINKIKPLINSASSHIDNIIKRLETTEPLIKGYEDLLNSEKENLEEDIVVNLQNDLEKIKRYTVLDNTGYNFSEMKQILNHNLSVLTQTASMLEQGSLYLQQEQYQLSRESFIAAGNSIQKYQIKRLTLDYSTLVLEKKEKRDPLGKMEDIIKSGITGMVIDPDTISEAALTVNPLPSEIAALDEMDENIIDRFTTFFQKVVIGRQNSGMGELFGSFGSDADIMTLMENGLNAIAEQFLFQEYLKEHFETFPKEGENTSVRKPSALTYEQEYLIGGQSSDKENLSSIISRIIFLRTILNFVSILGDKTKCSEAELAAAALVGFTGFPILVSITKTLILLIWSFDEALVDTSALLMGKKVPLLKKEISLQFPELFILNRTTIEQKASSYSQSKELSLSYQDYISIFLLMKNKKDLSYRSIDLIQENIKLRYEVPFQMNHCLFGYQIRAGFMIPPKFSSVSFVRRILDGSKEGFRYNTVAAYSY
jgi:hypothetical protein